MTTGTDHQNGEDAEVEKKPGVVRKITKITFTIGPIKQEDLSTPELNKLMAMAQRFDISFDTVTILDSDQTDKLGYITLPFEIRSQEYLLVLYDRLNNLKLNPARDVSVKFPEEFRKHIDEMRQITADQRKAKLEAQKKKAELQKRSIYATYVDKDTGKDSLVEKFPEAKVVTMAQYNFQWFGQLEFETVEKALEVLKANSTIEIEGQKVKIVRLPPNYEEEKKKEQSQTSHRPPQKSGGHRGGSGGGGNRGGYRQNSGGGGGGGYNAGPKPLMGGGGGRGGYGGGGYGGGNMGQGVLGRYQDYGGGYGGGYGNQGYGNQGGAGNFQLGAKRKSDYSDFGGSPKKTFGGSGRGGYGRGGGGGNWF